jgi:2-haloacid dehalogenase
LTIGAKYIMLLVVILRNYRKRKAEKRLKEECYILSLDGGGMRGVIPATILGHIDSLFHELGDKRPLHAHFDLIAGTSTGGLIACALSNPNEINLETREIVNLYLDHGPSIFPKGSPILPLNFEQGLITIEDLKVERFRRFHQKYAIDSPPEESAKAYEEELSRSFHLYADALPILEHLSKSGIALTLITNGISAVQRGRLVATKTLHYFSAIVISEEIGVQKPNRAFFDKALEMASPTKKPLVIGDSLTSDIAGANNAGLDSCWVNRYKMVNTEGIKTTYEITSLEELLPLIENFN